MDRFVQNGKTLVRVCPNTPVEIKEKTMLSFILFLIGLMIGGIFGVVMMCLLQINRINEKNRKEDDDEKDD